MEDSKNKLEAVQGTSEAPNQSLTGADTVEQCIDELQSVDEPHHHHRHESLDVERLENSVSALRLQFKELICERDELKLINGSYKQELLLSENRNKRLKVENNKLKVENMALRDRINDLVLQSNNFNEKSLLKIFSYLSVDDMMQVKRVCKQWYQVSQQWFKQVQTLVYHVEEDDIADAKVQLYDKYFKQKVYEKKDIYGFNDIISILHSCGHYIKYLKADIFICGRPVTEECGKFIFKWVPQLCKNIVDVELTERDVFMEPVKLNFEFMAKHWEKLEKIEIQCLPKAIEENFLKLLQNNNQLKTLELWFPHDYDSFINDNFFTCLPSTIKKIDIKYRECVDTEDLSNFIIASKNFTSLQSLEFSEFYCLSDTVAAAIANITSLTHLGLAYVECYESRGTINKITNLKDLKSLYLVDNNDLHEDDIINIVESCMQLDALVIHGQDELTDRGLAVIAKMKKLKCLEIDADNVTVESIINFCYWLEVLCLHDSKMNNGDAIKFLKKASNLRYVNFDNCKNLTQDILQEANKIANERKENILVVQAFSGWSGNERRAFSDGNPEDIDTPYFKYFKNMKIPSRIFSKDIENFIEDEYK